MPHAMKVEAPWQPWDFVSGFGAMMAASAGGLGLHVNLRAGQSRVAAGESANRKELICVIPSLSRSGVETQRSV